MNNIALECHEVGKAYRIGAKYKRAETLGAAVARTLTAPLRDWNRLRGLDVRRAGDEDTIVWALKDVSFRVETGEVLGLVGRNGAGKSTLLKILSGITLPTVGSGKATGRISSLLEVGTGFHPELSGRENIFMNGTILGMSTAEIRSKFDEIVEFSGVETFLDTPVKRYSSGMKVRLGFAVAAHLEPEILIIDEVLAVGDAEFQKRCLGKMENVASSGRTVIFVSHNMGAIQSLCTRALALRGGQVVDEGVPSEVIQRYLADTVPQGTGNFDLDNPERQTSGELYLTGGHVLGAGGMPTEHLSAGEEATFVFDYDNPSGRELINMTMEIRNGSGVVVHFLNAAQSGFNLTAGRKGQIRCRIPQLALPTGEYAVRTALGFRGERADMIPTALAFSVADSQMFGGRPVPNSRTCAALTNHEWQIGSAATDLADAETSAL